MALGTFFSAKTESALPILALKDSVKIASFGCFLHPIKRIAMISRYFIPKDTHTARVTQYPETTKN